MRTDIKKDTILFIALDAYKKFHHAAYVEDGRGKEVIDYGQIKGSKIALTRFLKKVQSKYPNATFHIVYEAGPCGFWIYRHITSLGLGAAVTSFLRPGYPRLLEIVYIYDCSHLTPES